MSQENVEIVRSIFDDRLARMSSDVIIGHDGKPRCVWAGAGDAAFGRYHDEVWGCAREVLRDHPQAGTAIRRRPTQVDPQAEAFAKQLKSQGYRFVGPPS